jgi:hypothetical protein
MGVTGEGGTPFDMSLNTSLALVYTKPSGATLAVTPTLGSTTETLDGQEFTANTWWFYDFQTGELDETGDWNVDFTYTNTTPNPDDIFQNLSTNTLGVAP